MKKYLFTILLLAYLSMSFNAKAQTTSLEVDCQNPGWLSSLITYSQQQTLENLKVTGYINGTDLKFIRNLNTELSLHGVLDLENASIVSGGESFYTAHWNMNYSQDIYTETNKLPVLAFAYLKSLQKVVLPKTLTEFSSHSNGGYQFLETYVDTLVINGTMEDLTIGTGFDDHYWEIKCIYIPEGVKKLYLGSVFHSAQEIYFPSTLESVGGNGAAASDNLVFHCNSINPENIQVTTKLYRDAPYFQKGTIYIPKGTTEKYKNSVFKNLTIIEDIPVESVQFFSKSATQYVGDKFDLVASVLPSDAVNKDITYEVSNPEVIAKNEDGTFDAKKYGTSKVYAYSKNKEFSDECEVQVYDRTTGISISPSLSLKIGERFQLDAKTLPENTSDNIVTYSTFDERIARVDENGLLIGVAKGTTTITASSKDGLHKAECIVSVTPPVTSISLSEQSLSLKVGETQNLMATISPNDADNKNIIWESDDTEIVSVDNGKVTALKAGETYVRAISEDNQNIVDRCLITVTQPVTGITLNYSEYTFGGIGSTLQIEATIMPENASNKNINWKSSNENVCIVSNGKVVAVGFGTSVIIATTVDGAYMAVCTIMVEEETGLIPIQDSDTPTYKIYDISGKEIPAFRTGVNIIKFSDGSSVKIVK